MKIIPIIVFIFIATSSFGQSFTAQIDSVYTFKPSRLTDKEQESKFPQLDKFWNKVKSDTSKYLPLLRIELLANGYKPFFYYDGSALLLSLSKNKYDKELAAQAISKCDLDDISPKVYVSTLNKLAHEGIDVTAAAVKILYDDKFAFFIPQHAMTFNQGYCLAYMLLPQKSTRYIDTLISKFAALSSTAQNSIITTLWLGYSCKGDNFLKALMRDASLQKDVRDHAKRMMSVERLTRVEQSYFMVTGKENLDDIRTLALQRYSDEAINELVMTTRIVRSKQKCR